MKYKSPVGTTQRIPKRLLPWSDL